MEPELPESGGAPPGDAIPRELIEALPVPAGATVEETAHGLELTVPRKPLVDDTAMGAGLLLLAGLATGVATSVGAGAGLMSARGEELWTLLSVLAVMATLGGGPVVWALVARQRNHVRLTIDAVSLTLREAPVPFSIRRALPRDGLLGLELVPGAGSAPTRLDAVYADGSRHQLLARVGDQRYAGFLAARVGLFLEGPRMPQAQARSKSTTSASDEARMSTKPGELA